MSNTHNSDDTPEHPNDGNHEWAKDPTGTRVTCKYCLLWLELIPGLPEKAALDLLPSDGCKGLTADGKCGQCKGTGEHQSPLCKRRVPCPCRVQPRDHSTH